ncbi:hypothetical protein F4809DRAFT_624952 [Biscogniauxia mediterranea]|nr:hypothetical protein F4809DRAFT_624952 [Biscogniauxia mediterranea]
MGSCCSKQLSSTPCPPTRRIAASSARVTDTHVITAHPRSYQKCNNKKSRFKERFSQCETMADPYQQYRPPQPQRPRPRTTRNWEDDDDIDRELIREFSWLAPAISIGGTNRRGPKPRDATKSPDTPSDSDRHRQEKSRPQHSQNPGAGRRGPALRVETDWPLPGKGSPSRPAAGHDVTAEKRRYQRGRGPPPAIHAARAAPTARDATRRAEKGRK